MAGLFNPDSLTGNKVGNALSISGQKPVSQNSLSVGNRVFNGFSPSPHVGGGIDKGGYAKRDMQAETTRNLLIEQMKNRGA